MLLRQEIARRVKIQADLRNPEVLDLVLSGSLRSQSHCVPAEFVGFYSFRANEEHTISRSCWNKLFFTNKVFTAESRVWVEKGQGFLKRRGVDTQFLFTPPEGKFYSQSVPPVHGERSQLIWGVLLFTALSRNERRTDVRFNPIYYGQDDADIKVNFTPETVVEDEQWRYRGGMWMPEREFLREEGKYTHHKVVCDLVQQRAERNRSDYDPLFSDNDDE